MSLSERRRLPPKLYKREKTMENDDSGNTRNPLFSHSSFLFSLFFFVGLSVGRFRMVELMYMHGCSIREATTGEAKKGAEYNTILVTFANTEK